jgi:hypothetical protein
MNLAVGVEAACNKTGICVAHFNQRCRRQGTTVVGVAVTQDGHVKIGQLPFDVHFQVATTDVDRTGDMARIMLIFVPNI